MSVVNLHPEELFDKEQRGTLSESERSRLDSHVAVCGECRLERQMRADFQEEFHASERISLHDDAVTTALLAGQMLAPAPKLAELVDADVLGATEDGNQSPSTESGNESEREHVVPIRPSRRVPKKRMSIAFFAAAALFVATAAAAASPSARTLISRTMLGLFVTSEAPTAVTSHGTLAQGAMSSNQANARTKAESPSSESEVVEPSLAPSAVTAEAPPQSEVRAVAAEANAHATTASTGFMPYSPVRTGTAVTTHAAATSRKVEVTQAPFAQAAASAAEPRIAAPSSVPSASSLEGSATLFARATEARRSGNMREALRAYRELDTAFPKSREAVLAHAIVGRLLLDRGDAETAITEFDAYLHSNREELREQTMASRASAFERLGRSAQEASAWHALLADYPESAYRTHANSRLSSLGAP